MAYIDAWGNLRYVANQAFMALLHNKAYKDDGGRRNLVYTCFARKQLRYMMGETGKSYVVGVGANPVCREHHRAASCGALGTRCVYGALVGGPGAEDEFDDSRENYQQNEVALDWNAGFSSALAGLAAGDMPSWDECSKTGLSSGRGSTSGADERAPAGAWVRPLLVAAAAVAVGRLMA